MNAARQVTTLGQSLWLDNLSRSLIREGTLARMIAEDGISGVTSNPSIFQNALATSPYYADDLARLRAEQPDLERRYEALAIPDVQAACDLLDPVYEASGGNDGYVSLEVAPRWAHDAPKTVAEAQRLAALVNRRNLLVKVPGTHEGVSAFEALTTLGVNVNVTLLFSVAQVQAVFDAYIRGLAARARAGADAVVGHRLLAVHLADIALGGGVRDIVGGDRERPLRGVQAGDGDSQAGREAHGGLLDAAIEADGDDPVGPGGRRRESAGLGGQRLGDPAQQPLRDRLGGREEIGVAPRGRLEPTHPLFEFAPRFERQLAQKFGRTAKGGELLLVGFGQEALLGVQLGHPRARAVP